MTTAAKTQLKDQLAKRIAMAVHVRSAQVAIESCHVDVRSTSCTGRLARRPFFAKFLTADPYRVVSALPWREQLSDTATSRSRAVQFEVERNAARIFQDLASDHVPGLIGSSAREAVILWEKAEGERLDQLVSRTRIKAHSTGSVCKALDAAGAWLRRVHDASAEATQEFDLQSSIAAIKQHICTQPWARQTYARKALRLLQAASDTIGHEKLQLPLVLNHGDFVLANLLWSGSRMVVVDFENPVTAAPFYDLLTMTFSLRRKLLHPLVSSNMVQAAEKSFWQGYGDVPANLLAFINAAATARVLCQRPARQFQKRSWFDAMANSVYHNVLESSMLARCSES